MTEAFEIVGYCRISVDDELDRDNVSIENQKAIIADFVQHRFPGSSLRFFEDRDRSGYTFEQREGYQAMRRGLLSRKYDILVVKDFSRFSRRNSRGLVELEDLRDAGVRIISIGDGIDFPNDDDWLKIQFQFLINEMPVTDASKKVRAVVQRRQADGKWICAAPYGYLVNRQQQFEIVPTEAEIVRRVFELYLAGWGYKRIANYLTDEGIPTPRMSENARREAAGAPVRREARPVWAIATVQGILGNDFYIGTLRQGKTTRAKINGRQVERASGEVLVFEKQHQPILDERTFAAAQSLRAQRTKSNYRGVKRNDNVYSGYLECGDCGSPMFALCRPGQKAAYRCGLYHRRGVKACSSHHIRAETLDRLVKQYVKLVMERSAAMVERLNADLTAEDADTAETERAAENLEALLADVQEELRVTKRQRIRDIMRHPEREALLEETYDALEASLSQKLEGLQHQIELTKDRRSTILRVNRSAKLALDVFADILQKQKLDRNDLQVVIEKIRVFEGRIEVQLKNDIDALLRCGQIPNQAVGTSRACPEQRSGDDGLRTSEARPYAEREGACLNGQDADTAVPNDHHFEIVRTQARQSATPTPFGIEIIQEAIHHSDKVFRVNAVSDGDPLEIYTEKDGEVIFKKYSPMGDLTEFAGQICDSIARNTGHAAAVCDRDNVIAVAGAPKKALLEKPNSRAVEQLMEQRRSYRYTGEGAKLPLVDGERQIIGAAAPISAEGDLMGCVALLLGEDETKRPTEFDQKLVQTVAGFLGRQMEP